MFKDKQEKWIGVTQAADHFSVSRETVYRWIEERNIPCHKIGNLIRFKISDLDHWARSYRPKRAPKEKQLNILLVEDDPNDVIIAKRMLKSRNCSVVVAEDGEEALEILSEKNPDLIFLDLHLPRLNGIETLKKIKKSEKWNQLPIVILTGFSDSPELREILPYSPVTILAKPLDSKKLSHALKLLLHKSL